jgi:hypothetical protein
MEKDCRRAGRGFRGLARRLVGYLVFALQRLLRSVRAIEYAYTVYGRDVVSKLVR